MFYKNVKVHALDHLRAATSSIDLFIGLSYGRVTLG